MDFGISNRNPYPWLCVPFPSLPLTPEQIVQQRVMRQRAVSCDVWISRSVKCGVEIAMWPATFLGAMANKMHEGVITGVGHIAVPIEIKCRVEHAVRHASFPGAVFDEVPD